MCGFFSPLLFIFNFFFLFSGADLSEEQQPRPRRDRAGRMAGGRLPGLLFILREYLGGESRHGALSRPGSRWRWRDSALARHRSRITASGCHIASTCSVATGTPRRDRVAAPAGSGVAGGVRVSGRGPGLPALSPAVPADAAARLAAEQEVENLSGLSPNPEKDIFVVRENRTTCLMAEFAAKFIVPYDVWASNYVDVSGGRGRPGGVRGSSRTGDGRGHAHTRAHLPLLSQSPLFPPRIFSRGRGGLGGRPAEPRSLLQLITEQADIPLSRGAEMKGKCGTNESELELSWLDQAYTLKLSFLKVRARREPGRGRGGSAGS